MRYDLKAMDTEKSIRQRINESSSEEHRLSRHILGLDWYDTESQARRVIEWIVEQNKGKKDAAPES